MPIICHTSRIVDAIQRIGKKFRIIFNVSSIKAGHVTTDFVLQILPQCLEKGDCRARVAFFDHLDHLFR